MKYVNARTILPIDLVEELQKYIQAGYIYIPAAAVSYLDFEWETYAFPPYEGMKPFDVLVFQYSLHIEEQQELRHVGFIGERDCRRAFLEHLLAHIPKTGTILVYNMEGAEKLRLVQLAQQFPRLVKKAISSALRSICARLAASCRI